MEHATDLFSAIDAIAGFLGAAVAITYQEKRSFVGVITSLLVGVVAAVYGGPALAEHQNLSRAAESFCAFLIGLTARTHIIPGILEAAAVIGRLPSKWAKSKFKGGA